MIKEFVYARKWVGPQEVRKFRRDRLTTTKRDVVIVTFKTRHYLNNLLIWRHVLKPRR